MLGKLFVLQNAAGCLALYSILFFIIGNALEESVLQQKDSSEDEEDGTDGPVTEDDHLLTVEHSKQVIDDVKKLLIEDPSTVIAAWALLNTE